MRAELVVGSEAAEVRLIKADEKIVHEEAAIATCPKTWALQQLHDRGLVAQRAVGAPRRRHLHRYCGAAQTYPPSLSSHRDDVLQDSEWTLVARDATS